MKIETKFGFGDTIWFISPFKKAVSSTVRGIKIEHTKEKTEITYLCNDSPTERVVHIKVPESEAFPTKEELLASL